VVRQSHQTRRGEHHSEIADHAVLGPPTLRKSLPLLPLKTPATTNITTSLIGQGEEHCKRLAQEEFELHRS
jgi:hypothetical protein